MAELLSGIPSGSYFYTRSELAAELFFFPLCTGLSRWGRGSCTKRKNFDSYLIMYIASGTGYLIQGERELNWQQGDFVLVDCYRPHCYGTKEGCQVLWLHFDGVLARRYFELCSRSGPVLRLSSPGECVHQMTAIWDMFARQGTIREIEISRRITFLLTELMQSSEEQHLQEEAFNAVEQALGYIAENIEKPLTLEQLARRACLSPYYFLRLFKRKIGFTPHDYIVRARVDRAKYLLKSTDLPLKNIAEVCGFSNPCIFSSVFKKYSGVTPMTFRRE